MRFVCRFFLALALAATPALAGRKAPQSAKSQPAPQTMTEEERFCEQMGHLGESIGQRRDQLEPITETIKFVRRSAARLAQGDPALEQRLGDALARTVQTLYAHPEVIPAHCRFFLEKGCMDRAAERAATRLWR